MPKNVLARLKDTKIRSLLILGVMVMIAVIIALYFIFKEPEAAVTEESVAGKLPEISAIPGGATSERYQELLEEENRKRAEAARQAGTSAIATIIGARKKEGSETFGIEGQLLASQQQCVCPPGGAKPGEIPDLDPALAAKLISELRDNPDRALELLKQNPGLGKALCQQDPELAYQLMEKDHEAAKIILSECPNMAKLLAERNPELFKKLMLENPDLARQLAAQNPDLFKKLMETDPDFAKKLAANNPELVKTLMKNDPAFANTMGKAYPDLVKDLMRRDPEFAKAMVNNNPSLVKDLMKNDPEFAKQMNIVNPDLVKSLMANDPEFAKMMTGEKALTKTAKAGYDQSRARDEARRRAAQESAQVLLNEQQQKQKQELRTGMDNQAKAIFQSWNEYNAQVLVQGNWAEKKEAEAAAAAAAGAGGPDGASVSAQAAELPAMFKAGTILFAVLDTAINSDEPGPVLATIVDGQYRGAKLLGTMTATPQPGSQPAEKVTINFTQMNIQNRPTTLSIQAVAIDPDTARTAIATDVDHHYLLRYGTLLASSFITGYSKVITSQGTVQTSSANGLSTTTTTPTLSGKKEIFAALGEVGKKFGEATASWFDIPPTITVDAGTGIGVLILSDVSG